MIQLYRDPADFAHGTRARYVASKCRCDACRRANREYQAQRAVALRSGATSGALIDATEVRQHLLDLSTVGVGQCGRAYWVSLFQLPEFTDHNWPGAWQCSAFRNDGSRHLSSDLILDALAATVAEWGQAPREGMITFVDGAATAARRSAWHGPGHCFRVVGFRDTEQRTSRGYHVLRLAPADFPLPRPAHRPQAELDLRGAA